MQRAGSCFNASLWHLWQGRKAQTPRAGGRNAACFCQVTGRLHPERAVILRGHVRAGCLELRKLAGSYNFSCSACGCGSNPMVPFWGRCTTYFRTYFSGWIGIFTGGTIWLLTHGHVRGRCSSAWPADPESSSPRRRRSWCARWSQDRMPRDGACASGSIADWIQESRKLGVAFFFLPLFVFVAFFFLLRPGIYQQFTLEAGFGSGSACSLPKGPASSPGDRRAAEGRISWWPELRGKVCHEWEG